MAIPHHGERMAALKTAMHSAVLKAERDRHNISPGGGGLFDEIARLEADTEARTTSARESARLGVADPYKKHLIEKRIELEKARADALESEGVMHGHIRGVESEDIRRKRSDDDLLRGLNLRNRAFGKSGDAATLMGLETEGRHPATIARAAVAMAQHRRLVHGQDMTEMGLEQDEIGMKGRAIRDRKTERGMRKEGFTDFQIKQKIDALQKGDVMQDTQDLSDKIKGLSKALDEETSALNHNRDSMQAYSSTIREIDKQLKVETRADKVQELTDRKSALTKSVAAHDKAGVMAQFGMNKAQQFAADKKKLDDMGLPPDVYQRALADLRGGTSGGGGPGPSMGIHSTSDPGEAYSRLMAFREDAFAAKGDIREKSDGAVIKGGRRSVRQQQADLAKRVKDARTRQVNKSAHATKKLLGKNAYRRREERAFQAQQISAEHVDDWMAFEKRTEGPIEASIAVGEEQNIQATSRIGTPESITSNPYGGIGDTREILERIAKAVEKEAETKIETADLK